MPYEVRLDVFEGPIDLLLHLITRRRVDIYDVSIATITDEFVAALDAVEGLDLESATGFLVVAAGLLELKSARLLPGRSADDLDPHTLEERDVLLARLVECATFRSAGGWIGAGLERGAAYHGRTAGLEPAFVGLAPDLLASTRLDAIVSFAGVILAPRPAPPLDTSHIAPITASVGDAVRALARTLELRSSVSFADLCRDAGGRIDVIVRFLALLELFKAGAVELSQDDRFGRIRADWTGEVDLDAVLSDIDEYAGAAGSRPVAARSAADVGATER